MIIPKYKFNKVLNCYEEEMESAPDLKLYTKVGFNDMKVITQMEKAKEKREAGQNPEAATAVPTQEDREM